MDIIVIIFISVVSLFFIFLIFQGPIITALNGNYIIGAVAVTAEHSGNEIIVRAKDRKGNSSTAEAVIFRNR